MTPMWSHMDFVFAIDDRSHRLTCTYHEGDCTAVVTASDGPWAAVDLLLAVDDVEDSGFGECFWAEGGGEYRWMLRRDGARLTVVALWSGGTLTGWEHVLRAETDCESFCARLREQLATTRA